MHTVNYRIFGGIKQRSHIKQKQKIPSKKQNFRHEDKNKSTYFLNIFHEKFLLSKLISHMESLFQWFSSKTGARSACDHCQQRLHHLRVPFVVPYMTYIKTAQKMATGRETRSNPVPKFAVGEKVLCYEPDPNKARVLYESKVNFIQRAVFMLVGELTSIFRQWHSLCDVTVQREIYHALCAAHGFTGADRTSRCYLFIIQIGWGLRC